MEDYDTGYWESLQEEWESLQEKKDSKKLTLRERVFTIPQNLTEVLNRIAEDKEMLEDFIALSTVIEINSVGPFTEFSVPAEKFHNDPWFIVDHKYKYHLNNLYRGLTLKKPGRPTPDEDKEAIEKLKLGIPELEVRKNWDKKTIEECRDLHAKDRTWRFIKSKAKK